MTTIRVEDDDTVSSMKDSHVDRPCCSDAVVHTGNFEIRVLERRVDEVRPWGKGAEEFGKIEWHLSG